MTIRVKPDYLSWLKMRCVILSQTACTLKSKQACSHVYKRQSCFYFLFHVNKNHYNLLPIRNLDMWECDDLLLSAFPSYNWYIPRKVKCHDLMEKAIDHVCPFWGYIGHVLVCRLLPLKPSASSRALCTETVQYDYKVVHVVCALLRKFAHWYRVWFVFCLSLV